MDRYPSLGRLDSPAGNHHTPSSSWHPVLCLLATLWLSAMATLDGAPWAARWISPTDGDWDNPANWDLGRVPNNIGGETFVVHQGEHPVTIRVHGQVTVDRLNLGAGETIQLLEFDDRLTVVDRIEWTDGAISGAGEVVSRGYAVLRERAGGRLAASGFGRLILEGVVHLESVLRLEDGFSLTVSAGGQLHARPGAGLLDPERRSVVDNQGLFTIHGATDPFLCVSTFSTGTLTVGERTVEFPPQMSPDEWDIEIRDGALHFDGANLRGRVEISEGLLDGQGYIQSASVDDPISGRFQFDHLELLETTQHRFVLGNPPDRIAVAGPLALGGHLEIALAPGFTPRPDDFYEIVRAEGGITGEFLDFDFNPVRFGTRYPVGNGSVVLELTSDSKAVWARNYLPPPIQIQSAPLAFEFGRGCFVVPHAAIDLGSPDWAGGSLVVEMTGGANAAVDRLSLRRRMELPESDRIGLGNLANGDQTVLYRGIPIGEARVVGLRLTCELNNAATPEGVAALLLGIHYDNSELTPEWFREAANRYPGRSLRVTRVNGAGVASDVTREVQFPRIVGLTLGNPTPVLLTAETDVLVAGIFSDGKTLPLPKLNVRWTHNCGFSPAFFEGTPGRIRLDDGSEIVEDRCCRLSVASGDFRFETFVIRYVEVSLCALDAFGRGDPCATISPLGAAARGRGANTPVLSLATFHALESLMEESPAGRRLANLYRTHTFEVMRILLGNPALLDRARRLVIELQPGVAALLAGRGADFVITPAIVQELDSLWSEVASRGSAPLKTALVAERGLYGGFQVFSGRDFSRWSDLLALSVPVRSRIHISGVRRDARGFHVEVNDIPEAVFELWRSSDLEDWQPVTSAQSSREGFTVRFTDPAPPSGQAFYEVRQTESLGRNAESRD